MTLAWDTSRYTLTRTLFQRGLGLIYLTAFLAAANQFNALLGERGLLPIGPWIKQVPFRESPSLFYFAPKDPVFTAAAWLGVLLSVLVISGIADRASTPLSAAVWAALWLLYISFVNTGQTFYAFGWESLLLEAGFYAAFLGSSKTQQQLVSIILLRWLCFRIMFGAGLIKLRGDSCWHNMTCLDYHYETQPMPNPLSWYFHNAPHWTRLAGVWFNHIAELVVPFGYFFPQPVASIAGIITIAFQLAIIASGNFAWFNFLTIVLAIPALDNRTLGFIFRPRPQPDRHSTLPHRIAVATLAVVIVWLSIKPVSNMLSPTQIMNTSYNAFHLAGTYGAFGSITRIRNEIIVEGTDEFPLTQASKWREYEFRGKPGSLARIPPQIAPYHLRLDWLMWFAAMGSYMENPWFVHFMANLLRNDPATLSLIESNPFPGRPPRYIRAQLYEYHFTTPEERRKNGQWWKRRFVGRYFPIVSRDNPAFREILEQQCWFDK